MISLSQSKLLDFGRKSSMKPKSTTISSILISLILKSILNLTAKNKLLNYQKVKILYDLAVKIRNRAFHFENLYKLNDDQTPRISTRVGKTLVGIDPQMLENFINDVLFVLMKCQ